VASLPISKNYPYFYKRWEKTLQDFGAFRRIARTKGRMIVHLGAESVIETSIALYHTYGTPYIPGSSLKGLASSFLRQKQRLVAKERGQNSQTYKELATAYQILFGDQDEAGYIIFFDAHYQPASALDGQGREQPLHSDVMTVHHPKYYQGQQAPDDKQSPVPIPFLSATGCYLIALAAPDLQHGKLWIDFTFDLLAQALLEQGIGAKNSSGYGRMELVDPEELFLSEQGKALKKKIQNMDQTEVNPKIQQKYEEWLKLEMEDDKRMIAQVIIHKIEQTGYTYLKKKKAWYQELVTYIG
jgi:CRISPR-associated protein Cmr6